MFTSKDNIPEFLSIFYEKEDAIRTDPVRLIAATGSRGLTGLGGRINAASHLTKPAIAIGKTVYKATI